MSGKCLYYKPRWWAFGFIVDRHGLDASIGPFHLVWWW